MNIHIYLAVTHWIEVYILTPSALQTLAQPTDICVCHAQYYIYKFIYSTVGLYVNVALYNNYIISMMKIKVHGGTCMLSRHDVTRVCILYETFQLGLRYPVNKA